ncbi:unnamed protein product [Macrosiphum euphorbiae]|uniref:Uncharacterized protein n=1 Tax=Macrosiphum euphorbiae TaxID=13131 RepID=A0AAV0WB19_9HEMI|nr:unnamed protein product [Macrosiphum euphorbiae]
MPGGLVHKTTERKYPILRPRSIPSIFPNLPKYLTSSNQKRSAPKPRVSSISTKIKKTIPINIHNDVITQEPELQSMELADIIKKTMTSLSPEIISVHNYASPQGEFTVEDLHSIANKIVLPGNMWGMHQNPGKCTVFTHINDNFENDKIVHFSTTCLPNVILIKKCMYFPKVKSFEGLQNLLNDIHNLVICVGRNDDGKRSPEYLGSLPSNNKNTKIKRCPKKCKIGIQKTKRQNIQLRKKSKSYRQQCKNKTE